MSKLGQLLAEHRRLGRVMARASKRRDKISKFLKERLEAKGQERLEADGLTAHRYPTRRVDWDTDKLYLLLEQAGVPYEIIGKVLPRTVNEEELTALVEGGYVDMEQVHSSGQVRVSWSVRVDEIKESD